MFFVITGLTVLLFSCEKDEDEDLPMTLPIINSYAIDVVEPSGLVFDVSQQVLYTVRDYNNDIYMMGKNGQVFQQYPFNGEDTEGITQDNSGNLILVEERQRQVVKYITSTNNKSYHNIEIEENDTNSGLEGICYDSKDDKFYLLNEKNPGLLIVLDNQFRKIEEYKLSFATDYSGMCYDSKQDILWIVSDESKTLSKCDKKGIEIEQFRLNIDKAEGIALNLAESLFYMVSDSRNVLYEVEYPE